MRGMSKYKIGRQKNTNASKKTKVGIYRTTKVIMERKKKRRRGPNIKEAKAGLA